MPRRPGRGALADGDVRSHRQRVAQPDESRSLGNARWREWRARRPLGEAAGTEKWQTFVEAFGTKSPSKFSGIRLHPGDQVRLAMPGGGGYGDPRRRDRALVARDLAEGFVTAERSARRLRVCGMSVDRSGRNEDSASSEGEVAPASGSCLR